MPGHSIPLAILGTFILMIGFLSFNGGSQLYIDQYPEFVALVGTMMRWRTPD